MKYIIILLIFLNCDIGFSQENKEIKKLKCLKKMTCNYENFRENHTIYILHYKSNIKGFEQNKIDVENYDGDTYNFFNYVHFPSDIYDLNGFEKINYRKPMEMYKSKSFICKNIERTIDVAYLKNNAPKIYNDFYSKKKELSLLLI
jgi:hypothetical protein